MLTAAFSRKKSKRKNDPRKAQKLFEVTPIALVPESEKAFANVKKMQRVSILIDLLAIIWWMADGAEGQGVTITGEYKNYDGSVFTLDGSFSMDMGTWNDFGTIRAYTETTDWEYPQGSLSKMCIGMSVWVWTIFILQLIFGTAALVSMHHPKVSVKTDLLFQGLFMANHTAALFAYDEMQRNLAPMFYSIYPYTVPLPWGKLHPSIIIIGVACCWVFGLTFFYARVRLIHEESVIHDRTKKKNDDDPHEFAKLHKSDEGGQMLLQDNDIDEETPKKGGELKPTGVTLSAVQRVNIGSIIPEGDEEEGSEWKNRTQSQAKAGRSAVVVASKGDEQLENEESKEDGLSYEIGLDAYTLMFFSYTKPFYDRFKPSARRLLRLSCIFVFAVQVIVLGTLYSRDADFEGNDHQLVERLMAFGFVVYLGLGDILQAVIDVVVPMLVPDSLIGDGVKSRRNSLYRMFATSLFCLQIALPMTAFPSLFRLLLAIKDSEGNLGIVGDMTTYVIVLEIDNLGVQGIINLARTVDNTLSEESIGDIQEEIQGWLKANERPAERKFLSWIYTHMMLCTVIGMVILPGIFSVWRFDAKIYEFDWSLLSPYQQVYSGFYR